MSFLKRKKIILCYLLFKSNRETRKQKMPVTICISLRGEDVTNFETMINCLGVTKKCLKRSAFANYSVTKTISLPKDCEICLEKEKSERGLFFSLVNFQHFPS